MILRNSGSAGGHRQQASAGFTLLEMIVVLVVLGLAITLVISRGSQRSPTVEIRSVATRLLQGMRATRAQAIALDRPVMFGVDAGRHLYQVGADPPQKLPPQVALGVMVGTRPAKGIVFNPDGSAGGGVVTLADATRRMQVSVDWLSGRIAASVLPAVP